MSEATLVIFILLPIWYVVGLITIAITMKISKATYTVGDWLCWSCLGFCGILGIIAETIEYFVIYEKIKRLLKKEIFK